ncbi:methylated-DNA--[protein]-cysteine S-methyltransferase [Catenovulum maritimum]|uniref:methylated-DNA--[protein]-cysteine S-methyltransferase n=1 Tax=Catenovulum maritimum TaxID=1513271 RepID=A0A0J8GV96_9ALTE|nr:methylated-DNA--[protein]-cysteine S-methyltransferase [Catenovulum maritimum]KMT65229.1 hypothetical protein XM47_10185 [Catenovulum maritimum]
MQAVAQALMTTPIGLIAVKNTQDALIGIELQADKMPYSVSGENNLTAEIVAQINAYFAGELQIFDLPIYASGTNFQTKVWQQLKNIDYGHVLTYGEFAKTIETSARAIGGACRHNPIPIVIPCHRIVAANGIGGYSGQWRLGQKVDVKRWLLTHEQKQANPDN